MVLYPGNGRGGFLAPVVLSSGWGGFSAFVSPKSQKVFALDSDGNLRSYTGAGNGYFMDNASTPNAFGAYAGYGWGSFSRIGAPGDFDGDGVTDVYAITADGRLTMFFGLGDISLKRQATIGWGWSGASQPCSTPGHLAPAHHHRLGDILRLFSSAGSRRKVASRRVLTTILGLAVTAVLSAPTVVIPSAVAATLAPQLASLTRTSPDTVVPGGNVVLGFTLSQPAQHVVFDYTDNTLVSHHLVEWAGASAMESASASVSGDSYFNGPQRLISIRVSYGSHGEEVVYSRDGTSQSDLAVPWDKLDFTVDNPAKPIGANENTGLPTLGIRADSGAGNRTFEATYGTWAIKPTAIS